MQTPPPLPTPPRPDWWSRNWKWFVPITCLAGVGAAVGATLAFFAVMRSSDAYVGAVARAKSAPAVITAIGDPIKEGLFFTGQIKMIGAGGTAELEIPLDGTKGEATVHVVARRAEGKWHYDRLIVQIASDGRQFDLSEK